MIVVSVVASQAGRHMRCVLRNFKKSFVTERSSVASRPQQACREVNALAESWRSSAQFCTVQPQVALGGRLLRHTHVARMR
jgi:hypothetical protein